MAKKEKIIKGVYYGKESSKERMVHTCIDGLAAKVEESVYMQIL